MPPAPPPRIRTPLGPYALINPTALALKAGAATLVALWLDGLTGNPDIVSSTFVAVLCTSPTLVMGVRQGLSQLAGSVLGGALGTLMLLFGVPMTAGIPLAVAGSIGGCFALSYPQGYPVAAFSALFVQAIPRGGPAKTFGVRMLAVSIAALAGFVVNLVVSAWSYRRIFLRRLRRAEEHADALLVAAATEGPRVVHPGFALLSQLENETAQTCEELRWRRRTDDLAWVRKVATRVEAIHHLLHLVYDLGLQMEDDDVPLEEVAEFLRWARCGEGPRPPLPGRLDACGARIETLWADLHRNRVRDEPATGGPAEDGEDAGAAAPRSSGA